MAVSRSVGWDDHTVRPSRSGPQWDLGRSASAGAAVARFMRRQRPALHARQPAAIAVIVVGGFFALRSVAIDEAKGDTRDRVRAEGRLVEAAGLSDGILRGDQAAIRRLDDLVLGQVLGGSVVRVKLWSQDGEILYSDEPALIGTSVRARRRTSCGCSRPAAPRRS